MEFNNLAVRFSSFSKTIAGDGGDVTGTLADLTGRASDFASVMNLDVNEAAQLFQSGLAGESEPLRRYGLDMSAASVEAYGLANGLAANGKSLTESEKIQARYGYLMEQTSNTQGDFANTSDQLANKQRITAAEFDNVKARIGTGLLPIMSALVGFVGGTLLPSLDSVGSFLTDTLIPGIQSFGKWLSDSKTPITAVAGVITAILLPALVRAGVLATISAAQQVAGWVASAAGAVASGAVSLAQFVIQGAKWVWMGVVALASAAQIALAWIISMGPIAIVIAAVVGLAVLIALNFERIKGWIGGAWEWIKTATSTAWEWIKANLKTIIEAIIVVITGPIGLLAVLIFENWDKIKTATSTAWNAIRDFFSGLWTSITSRLTSAWNAIVGFFSAIPGRVGAFFTMVKNKVVEVFGYTPLGLIVNNWDAIVGFFRGLPAKIGNAVSGMWDGITGSFKGALNTIIRWWNNFSFSLTIPSNSFTNAIGLGGSGFTVRTPNISYLAEGALVTNPALAMLGESGHEAVLPFSRVDEFAAMVARQMGQMDLGAVGGGGDTYHVQVSIPASDVRDFTDVVEFMSTVRRRARQKAGVS